jgi:CRISPR-associated protein Csm4
MFKKLIVQLKSGVLSSFQSDTTLGIFCWRLKQQYGEEKLIAFLDRYRKGKPIFTISNELFEINGTLFLVKPVYDLRISKQGNSKKEKIGDMLHDKENRSQNYISLRQLNAFLNGDFKEYSKKEDDIYADEKRKYTLTPGFTSELRVSVEIDRNSSRSKDGQLFSYHPKYLKEGNRLAFLIKILDDKAFEEFNCEKVLKEVFEIGYGKKKSSGYGYCKVLSFEDFNDIKEPENSNGFISLSNYLPAKADNILNGIYDTNVKYGRLGEELSLSRMPFKKPMLMIKPGAVFFTENKKDFYGRVTNDAEVSPVNSFVVQFGMPFTLNFYIQNTD